MATGAPADVGKKRPGHLRSVFGGGTLLEMEINPKYRGRKISAADVVFIRQLIAEHPTKSRRALSQELCRAWQWVQANGALREMVCRGLMLELHRAGHIELPPVRWVNRNPFVERNKPARVAVDQTPIRCALADLGRLDFRQVRRTSAEKLFGGLIEEHHYLGYTHPVGEQLKYLVYAHERPIACFAWSSAPRHLGCRDRFIGWSADARRRNIRFLAYNSRFLIMPWINVPHLASHLLGRMARKLSREWLRVYGHPVYFLETFINPERFRGTCYRAANWVFLGRTTGRGKDAPTHKPTRSIKEVLGYSLSKYFRERLSGELA